MGNKPACCSDPSTQNLAESIPPAQASDLDSAAPANETEGNAEKRPQEQSSQRSAASVEGAAAAKLGDSASTKPDSARAESEGAMNTSAEGEEELAFTTFEFTNGSYKGQVNKRKDAHGLGTFTSKIGAYEGQWQDGKHHGDGTQTWSDGRVYSGEFVAGQFGGKGKMTWHKGEDKITYEGEYVADKKHGVGKMIWPSGEVYDGEWVMGKRHGKARVTTPGPSSVERDEVWENDACVSPPPAAPAAGKPAALNTA